MGTKEKKLDAWFQAIQWNQSYPIGTPVVFDSPWSGPHLCFTRSPSQVLIDAPCVWVTGHMGAVILDRIQHASEAGIRSVQVVSECVNGPLLVPLTTHSPTHPGSKSVSEGNKDRRDGIVKSARQNAAEQTLHKRRRRDCKDAAEPTVQPTLQYPESYRKEWIFGQICIRVEVSVMNCNEAKTAAQKRKAIASKAARVKHALHRQRIEATGITFAEHQRKLNRLRVQRWREKQPRSTEKSQKAA
jgi:hypothetical protein